MSWASNLAADRRVAHIVVAEFEGNLDADMGEDYEATTNWTAGGEGGGLAVETTNTRKLAGAIAFDKSGTSGVAGYVSNASLAPVDLSDPLTVAYETCWVYLASVADLVSVDVHRGSDASNYRVYTYPVADLAAGWSLLRWDASEVTPYYASTTGTPADATTDYLRVGVTLSANGDTLAGVLHTPPRQHPYRLATGKITAPLAPTKYLMELPTVRGPSYDVRLGKLATGSAQALVVEDSGDTIATQRTTYLPEGRPVTYRMGFAGDAEDVVGTNYVPLMVGVVTSMTHKGRAWDLASQGVLKFLDVPFMLDASAASPVTVAGNLGAVALRLATSTGDGNNGDHDTLPSGQGASIPWWYFDADTIESTDEELRSWLSMSFTFRKPEPSFLQWLQREILHAGAAAPAVSRDGRVSWRAVEEAVYPGSAALELTDAQVCYQPRPQASTDIQRIRNQVRGQYDYDATDDQFDSDTGDDHQLPASVAQYGLRELLVPSKGITDATDMERVCRAHLYRLGDGSPPLEFTVTGDQYDLQMGDLPLLTSSIIPDIEAGTYSMAGKFVEVEQASFSPHAPAVQVRAGQTSYRRGNFRRIAPNTVPDYGSQTAAQKARYLSIAATGTGKLGSGADDGHEIGP